MTRVSSILGMLAAVVMVSSGPATSEQVQNPTAQDASKKQLLEGYRRYHSVCNHCHGPDGMGTSFGPSLIDAEPDEVAFKSAIRDGVKTASGVMKGFKDNPDVMAKIDDIYAYIAARARGDLGRGRPR